MRTPTQAMIWELWRTSRMELALRIAGTCTMIGLVSLFVSTRIEVDGPTLQVFRGIGLVVIGSSSLFSASWLNSLDNTVTGFSFRLAFTRPVSTTHIVVVSVLYILCSTAVCFIVPAILVSVLVGGFPIIEASVLMVTAVSCLVAATWSPSNTFMKVLALTSVCACLFGGFLLFHRLRDFPDPFVLALGRPEYLNFKWYHYASLMLVSVCAIGVTIAGVDRQRHGDRWYLAGALRPFRDLSIRIPRRTSPFSHRLGAQLWYEMRRFGFYLLLLGFLLPLFLFALLGVFHAVKTDWRGAPYVWLVATIIVPIVCQLSGSECSVGLKRNQGAVSFPTFDAVQGIRNDELIAIKLIGIAIGSFAGAMMMAIAASIDASIWGDWGVWLQIRTEISPALAEIKFGWWIIGIANAAFLFVCNSTVFITVVMWMPLYPGRLIALSAFCAASAGLAIWDWHRGWELIALWQACAWTIAIVLPVICVIAIREAVRTHSLDPRWLAVAVCFWGLYVVTTVYSYATVGAAIFHLPISARAACLGMLTVPLASAAIAPLALGAHRHG